MGEAATRSRILIVEDLPTLSLAYAAHVERAGYRSLVVPTAAAALAQLSRDRFCAVLLDLQLPDADGLDLLRDQRAILADLPVIVITSDGSLSRAVDAMRLGAYDYLVKPVSANRLVSVVDDAVSKARCNKGRSQNAALSKGVSSDFIGHSPQMKEVYRQIELVSNSRATVFITGETGTGKELCAEAIHRHSDRVEGPFIAINCGAIPENLLESELFGHIRGSFTGAVSNRVGAAQAADKGTLFLDEICEMPLQLQVKLLRFLQTGTIQRIGSDRDDKVDVRIVCATNRNPAVEVAEGRFREDLFYRLSVIPIEMPPLRERGQDLPLLAQSFLDRFSDEFAKQFDPLSQVHLTAMACHTWPGNVRELQNVMLRAVLLNPGPAMPLSAIPVASTSMAGPSGQTANSSAQPDASRQLRELLAGLTLSEVEALAIDCAIDATGGNLAAAANSLGISLSTIYRKRGRTGATN